MITFAALGTRWTIRSSSRRPDALAAERFAAAAQIMLVETAEADLLLLPTSIEVLVAAVAQHRVTAPAPGSGAWKVELSAYDDGVDANAFDTELMTAVMVVLCGASLADDAVVNATLQTAFERGLTHKIATGRPYDELVGTIIDAERYEVSGRASVAPTWTTTGVFRESAELAWNDSEGPTYSRARSEEMISRRYQTLERLQIHSLPALLRHAAFLELVDQLPSAGWRDLHIVTGVHNVTLNELRLMTVAGDLSAAARRRVERMAYA